MTCSRSAIARWATLGGLLLLGMLVAGLMAMHGMQAASPAGMSGVPVVGMHHPGSAAARHMPGEPMDPAAPMPAHDHPGGQVCLGLLVLAITLALTYIGLIAPAVIRNRSPGRRIRTLLLLVGRPPPSIYHLAVLRL
jgi:hypothetical protein